jgi:hypothetical protein
MVRNILLSAAFLLTSTIVYADAKDDVQSAAKKLADSPNYTWKTSSEGGQGNRGGGSTQGKADKDGTVYLTIERGNNTMEGFAKGDKGAVKLQDGWKSLEEAGSADAGGGGGQGRGNPGRMMAGMLKNFRGPAQLAQDLAGKTTDLKSEDGAITGTLSEEGVKDLMAFGGRARRAGGGGANAPQITNGKGTVKFWVKDGLLSKYQTHLTGTMSRNGNDTDIDRTTTTEITDVGTTKIDIPAEAKSKAGI